MRAKAFIIGILSPEHIPAQYRSKSEGSPMIRLFNRLNKLAGLFLFTIWPLPAYGQVPVALAPTPRMQFFSEQTPSLPLAGGKVCTFNAGTTTLAATYVDIGGVIQNTNPIILDGSGFATIYLANQEYKFVVYDSSGNTACPNSGVQQWAQDNVSAFQPVVGTQTIIFAGVTVDPIGQAGMMDYRTDIPCFRGFTSVWDCFVRLADVQTLTNKTLTAPTITNPTVTTGTFATPTVNSVQVVNSPGTYVTVANSVTGTVNNRLTKLVGGLAQFMATTDSSGSIGITATGGGGSGTTATIQQSGQATCFFDNATTAGDYVQISALTGGSCHDFGATLPTTGQIIGRVLVTSALSATPLSLDLFSPEIIGGQVGAATGCNAIGPVTVTNTVTTTTLLSCPIPANTLAAGSVLAVDINGVNGTGSGFTLSIATSLGGGTPCTTASGVTSVASNQPWNHTAKLFVLTAGGGGTANWGCEYFSSSAGGGVVGPNGVIGAPTISINTTISNTLLVQATMNVANASNTVTGQVLKAVIF